MLMTAVICQASVSKLRTQCADYVRSHSTDFLPFTTDPKTGELFTEGMAESNFMSVVMTATLHISGTRHSICFSPQISLHSTVLTSKAHLPGVASWK